MIRLTGSKIEEQKALTMGLMFKTFTESLNKKDEEDLKDISAFFKEMEMFEVLSEGYGHLEIISLLFEQWEEILEREGIESYIIPAEFLISKFSPEELNNKAVLKYFIKYAQFAQFVVSINAFSSKGDRFFTRIPKDFMGDIIVENKDMDLFYVNFSEEIPETTILFTLDEIFQVFAKAIHKHILANVLCKNIDYTKTI